MPAIPDPTVMPDPSTATPERAMPTPIDATIEIQSPTKALAKVRPENGVLLVEDDPDMQSRLARLLTLHGARVVGTSSGEAALAVIEQWPADLVLIDQSLPGTSGLEIARKIRALHPSMPVVLMSSEENAELRLAAKIAGAVGLLIKPFRIESISDIFARLKQAVAAGVTSADGQGEDLAAAE